MSDQYAPFSAKVVNVGIRDSTYVLGVVSENGKNRTLSTAKKLVMDRHATVAGRACPLLSCP
ncbi:transposase [Salmonella enterica subsp. enterica]|nr:transposase [Salmonella enterica subsp. enterica]